jgi:hypothetical protein
VNCYICGGRIGVFQWTDETGVAHPWCATGESWDWKMDSNPEIDLRDAILAKLRSFDAGAKDAPTLEQMRAALKALSNDRTET